MHLNLFTDLSLRVLMRLAGGAEEVLSVRALADELGVSHHHLKKVAGTLSAAGILRTRRGHKGGIRLAVSPPSLELSEIVRLTEGSTALVECFREDGGDCTLTQGCLLKGRLAVARESFLNELNKSTLEDICYFPPSGVQHV